MIKAVIFDCFGVLSTEGFREFCAEYFEGQPAKHAEAQELMNQSNLGHISYQEFVKQLAELADATAVTVSNYLDNNLPNKSLFAYIREGLKPKYKIGMLSNASSNWLSELFLAGDLALFDDTILSYEVGMTKPDPQIYKLAAKNLKVSPEEAIFIDDVDRYCEGAREAGMQAIHYEDFSQMKAELEKILG